MNNQIMPADLTIPEGYSLARKIGRCFNGAERDGGTIQHIVPVLPSGCGGDWFSTALCGAEPGRRGNGWSKNVYGNNLCPKCLKKINQTNK